LGHEGDRSALGDRGIERVDALLPADLERDDHLRKDDRLPERDERQLPDADCERLRVDRVRRSLGHGNLLLCRYGAAGWPLDALATRRGPPGRNLVIDARETSHGAHASPRVPASVASGEAVVPSVYNRSRILVPSRSSSSNRIRTPARLTPR